ncbi:MAG: PQQ-dependent sugar dehydrogenase [Solirubrobacteraceae bacterium]
MIRPFVLAVAVVAALLALASPALALDARLVEVPGPFSAPIYVTAPPGDASRLFVVERAGKIQVLRDGVKREFVDITAKVTSAGEGGLLSMAFAPDYATSGRFYVYYTRADDDPLTTTNNETGDIRIEEYQRSPDPDAADRASARVVIDVPHPDPPTTNHNGGQLQFGPDGFLYAATGDGGGGGDPLGNGQSTTSRLGKMLRIDPRGGPPYAIPPGNPFASGGGAREVWAIGLRNPYRFSFDRLTGDLAIGDVGQGAQEEVDFLRAGTGAGANLGWNRCEGDLDYPSGLACPLAGQPGYVAPAFTYGRAGGACSITGGYVVRDTSLPALYGRYLYGDFCTGRLGTVELSSRATNRTVETDVALPAFNLASFGEDARGCVYVALLSGKVYRLGAPDGAAPCPSPPSGGAGGTGGAGSGAGAGTATVQLGASLRRRQPVLRQRGIRVAVRCSTRCTVRTRTTIAVGGKRHKVARASRVLDAGVRATLRIPLSARARAALTRAFRGGGTGLATLALSAQDAAGRVDREARRVRLVR